MKTKDKKEKNLISDDTFKRISKELKDNWEKYSSNHIKYYQYAEYTDKILERYGVSKEIFKNTLKTKIKSSE